MIDVVKDFYERLGIKFNDELVPYYNKGFALFREKGLFAIDKNRLCSLNEKYNIFRKWFDDILLAADAVDRMKTFCYLFIF